MLSEYAIETSNLLPMFYIHPSLLDFNCLSGAYQRVSDSLTGNGNFTGSRELEAKYATPEKRYPQVSLTINEGVAFALCVLCQLLGKIEQEELKRFPDVHKFFEFQTGLITNLSFEASVRDTSTGITNTSPVSSLYQHWETNFITQASNLLTLVNEKLLSPLTELRKLRRPESA